MKKNKQITDEFIDFVVMVILTILLTLPILIYWLGTYLGKVFKMLL